MATAVQHSVIVPDQAQASVNGETKQDGDEENIKSKFSLPEPPEESCVVRAYLNTVPDISGLLRCGLLKETPCCITISKNIDNIMIVTLVVAIAVIIFCAISLFFVPAATAQTAFLTTGLIAGGTALLCGGSYVKRYLLLKRIQEEVKVLKEYRKVLIKQIEDQQVQIEKIAEENTRYHGLNDEQALLLKKKQTLLEEDKIRVQDLTDRIADTQTLLGRQQTTNRELNATRDKLNGEIVLLRELYDDLKNHDEALNSVAGILKTQREEQLSLTKLNAQLEAQSGVTQETLARYQGELNDTLEKKKASEERLQVLNKDLDEKLKSLGRVAILLESYTSKLEQHGGTPPEGTTSAGSKHGATLPSNSPTAAGAITE